MRLSKFVHVVNHDAIFERPKLKGRRATPYLTFAQPPTWYFWW